MSFYLKLCVGFLGIVYFGFWAMAKIASAAELPSETAYAIFDEVNEQREEAGLSPLEWNDGLNECSDIRAEEASVKWSHVRPNGQRWTSLLKICKLLGGENLAYCLEGDEESIIDSWMNSSAHRSNILYSDFRTGAVSAYTVDGETYVAMNFGY